jgi:hypothetical protein
MQDGIVSSNTLEGYKYHFIAIERDESPVVVDELDARRRCFDTQLLTTILDGSQQSPRRNSRN